MKLSNLQRETPKILKSKIEIENLNKSPYNININPEALKKCIEF